MNNDTLNDTLFDNYLKVIMLIHANSKKEKTRLILKEIFYLIENDFIFLNKENKKKIADKLKLSLNYINDTITFFYKSKFLLKKDRGVYLVNKKIFKHYINFIYGTEQEQPITLMITNTNIKII